MADDLFDIERLNSNVLGDLVTDTPSITDKMNELEKGVVSTALRATVLTQVRSFVGVAERNNITITNDQWQVTFANILLAFSINGTSNKTDFGRITVNARCTRANGAILNQYPAAIAAWGDNTAARSGNFGITMQLIAQKIKQHVQYIRRFARTYANEVYRMRRRYVFNYDDDMVMRKHGYSGTPAAAFDFADGIDTDNLSPTDRLAISKAQFVATRRALQLINTSAEVNPTNLTLSPTSMFNLN